MELQEWVFDQQGRHTKKAVLEASEWHGCGWFLDSEFYSVFRQAHMPESFARRKPWYILGQRYWTEKRLTAENGRRKLIDRIMAAAKSYSRSRLLSCSAAPSVFISQNVDMRALLYPSTIYRVSNFRQRTNELHKTDKKHKTQIESDVEEKLRRR